MAISRIPVAEFHVLGCQVFTKPVDLDALALESMLDFEYWCEKYPESPVIELQANDKAFFHSVAKRLF